MQSYAAIKMVRKTTATKKFMIMTVFPKHILIGIDDGRVLKSNKFVKCFIKQINRFLNYQIPQSL